MPSNIQIIKHALRGVHPTVHEEQMQLQEQAELVIISSVLICDMHSSFQFDECTLSMLVVQRIGIS